MCWLESLCLGCSLVSLCQSQHCCGQTAKPMFSSLLGTPSPGHEPYRFNHLHSWCCQCWPPAASAIAVSLWVLGTTTHFLRGSGQPVTGDVWCWTRVVASRSCQGPSGSLLVTTRKVWQCEEHLRSHWPWSASFATSGGPRS